MSFSTVRCRELWHICGICGQVSIDLRPEVFAPSFVIFFFFHLFLCQKMGQDEESRVERMRKGRERVRGTIHLLATVKKKLCSSSSSSFLTDGVVIPPLSAVRGKCKCNARTRARKRRRTLRIYFSYIHTFTLQRA